MVSVVVLGAASAGVKVATARLPSPKTLVGSPAQILAQFPKQQSPKQQSSPLAGAAVCQSAGSSGTSPGTKPTIQIKQESGETTNPSTSCFIYIAVMHKGFNFFF